MEAPIKSTIISATVVAMTALLYSAMLYFRVATASLHDNYQLGIEVLQIWISPGFLLGVVLGVTALFRSVDSIRTAVRSSLAALIICALMFGFVVAHSGNSNTWVFPQDRNLKDTIHTALFRPNFSNRSITTIIVSAGVAFFWLGASSRLLRRRKLIIHSTQSPSEGLTQTLAGFK